MTRRVATNKIYREESWMKKTLPNNTQNALVSSLRQIDNEQNIQTRPGHCTHQRIKQYTKDCICDGHLNPQVQILSSKYTLTVRAVFTLVPCVASIPSAGYFKAVFFGWYPLSALTVLLLVNNTKVLSGAMVEWTLISNSNTNIQYSILVVCQQFIAL